MFDQLDDTELLLISARRPEAFADFYRRHAEALLTYFVRRTFDPEIAADLTAETFAEGFASRARFRSRGVDGGAWLYGIARHQLSRFRRRGSVDQRARARLGMPRRSISSEDYERIEELVDFEHMRGLVGEAFHELSEDQQEAVTLRVVEGRQYAEIARMLGCSEQAARARVSRGMRRLSRQLRELQPELTAKVGMA
ncbi:MAG TPA: RNA polymerase sigma factor [Actinomycetota bacterium]|nr:RNA polymerase sigma factor [Actinomycetota bacterium]